MELPRTVQNILEPSEMAESILIWQPEKNYNPDDPGDFLAFQKTVLDKLGELVPWLARPVPDNPYEKSKLGRDLVQASWWVIGMLTSADAYLTAAKRRASYIQIDGNKPSADQLKYRMAEMYSKEQQIVSYLQRMLDLIDHEVVFIESDLKIIGKEMGLTGAESRL